MDLLLTLAPIAIFVVAVAVLYYRFRDNFFDLAAATDSKRSNTFWTTVALIFAVVIAILYSVFHVHGRIRW
jgi:Kef-type K+ transport system membrane component KefB